jgi:ferredoxin
MPEISLNDESLEVLPGEKLLDAARRKGAHVWFACDGRGLCRTCECRILEGAENLNPATALEEEMLSPERREQGYRLACQTAVSGEGTVKAVSQAEILRRLAAGILLPESPGKALENLTDLSNDMLAAAREFGLVLPAFLMNAIPTILKFPPSPDEARRFMEDAARVLQRSFDRSEK